MENCSRRRPYKLFMLLVTMLWAMMALVWGLTAVAAQSPTDDIIIYGSNNYEDEEMIEINLSQNSYQIVGYAAFGNQAMAQDPFTGYIYYFEAGNSGNEFAYYDPDTDENTLVRTYSPAPGFYAKRMDFAPDGTLYLMDEDENLYTMNPQTGDYEELGEVTGITGGDFGGTGDMAFAPDGTLYVNTYEELYEVDRTTLAATLLYEDMIDLTGVGITLWTGLAYCDGLLYASHGQQATASSSLFSIDPDTGTTTLLFATPHILNDLTSCQPMVQECDVLPNTYPLYIEPLTVTVTINEEGTMDCLSVRRFNANHPQATGPLQTGFHWDIQALDSVGNPATGYNIDLTLPTTFSADEDDKVCRYTGSGWDCAASSFTTNSVTREGITQLSVWTVGNNAGPTAVHLRSLTIQTLSSSPNWLTILFIILAGVSAVVTYQYYADHWFQHRQKADSSNPTRV